ncbi:MAG: MraY family glycosyltransferase [Verrucomicrobiota bacterium]
MIDALIAFFICFLLSLAGTITVLLLCRRTGVGLDVPDAVRKLHLDTVPRIGGLSIFLAYSVLFSYALIIGKLNSPNFLYVYLGSCLIFILGFFDDLKPLGARVKLIGQILIASVVYFLGFAITSFSYPMGGFSAELGILGYFVTVFWLISVPNIINLIDGVDGLAAGLGIFLYLTLGFVSWQSGQVEITFLSFGIAGALLGFLCFNFPPARIFLGDGGAYFVGFGVASLSMQSANKGSILAVLLVTVIALGLPIMDAALALVRRAVRGFPLFRADAEHIHHRLQGLGLSNRRVVITLYLLTAFFSLIGLSVFWSQGRSLPIAIGVLFIVGVIAIRYLGYIWKWSDITNQLRRSFNKRKDVEYTLLHAKLLELELERTPDWDDFAQTLSYTLKRCGLKPSDSTSLTSTHTLTLPLTNEYDWPLDIMEPDDHEAHWMRMAQCFVPARKAAFDKWPKEVADLKRVTTDDS